MQFMFIRKKWYVRPRTKYLAKSSLELMDHLLRIKDIEKIQTIEFYMKTTATIIPFGRWAWMWMPLAVVPDEWDEELVHFRNPPILIEPEKLVDNEYIELLSVNMWELARKIKAEMNLMRMMRVAGNRQVIE